jgi:hypothetical protein
LRVSSRGKVIDSPAAAFGVALRAIISAIRVVQRRGQAEAVLIF